MLCYIMYTLHILLQYFNYFIFFLNLLDSFNALYHRTCGGRSILPKCVNLCEYVCSKIGRDIFYGPEWLRFYVSHLRHKFKSKSEPEEINKLFIISLFFYKMPELHFFL